MPSHNPDARLGLDAFAHFEHLTQAVLVTDTVLSPPGPRIVYANPAFERMSGWRRAEILGRTPRILQGGETDRALMRELKAHLKRGEPWEGETTNYRRDGTPFVMKWSVAPVFDAAGKVRRYVAIQENVTARRALARREAHLNAMTRQLMTAASEGIVVTDADQRITSLGAGAERIFGWQADEVLGEPVSMLIPRRYQTAHVDHMDAYAAQGGDVRLMAERGEVVGLHRDGHEFPAMVTVAGLDDDGGSGFIAIVRDLSIMKAQARKLAESERRYRSVFDLTYQFVGLLSADGTVLEANQTALAFFGGEIGEVRGRHFLQTPWFTDSPEARETARGALDQAAAGTPVRGRMDLHQPNGTWRTLDFSVRPVLDTDGRVEYLISEGRDITDVVRSTQALKQRTRQLKEAQRIARLGDWHWDIPSGALFWGRETYRIFGLDAQTQPTYERFLDIVHPDDRADLKAAVTAALAGEDAYALDHRIVRPDGSERIVHEQAEVRYDNEERPVAMVGVVQDITERKRLERALLDAKRDAETANEAKSRFLSTMGHELRTPLNAINGFSQLLAEEMFGPLGSPQYREYAHLIQQSGDHLLDVINTILDATRVESGRMELAADWFDAPAFLSQTVELAHAQRGDREVEVALATLPNASLLADRRLLRQGVLNLIGNAVKFSPVGSRVVVGAEISSAGALEITVVDKGSGIPSRFMDHVTLPFFQADDSLGRCQDGSGLGLYLAKSFVELHNGSLSLASPPAGGTVATLKLPPSRVRRG